MKKFKNSFGVKGSPSLLQALKEEAEKLGWKYDKDFNSGYSKRNPDLYFNANKPKDAMKPQHFSFSNVGNCIIYNLPEQWCECLKAASELEEEVPAYEKQQKEFEIQELLVKVISKFLNEIEQLIERLNE